ncbi:MAG: vWA domain-containing protein [Candidatus Diapherotrites archaeon]
MFSVDALLALALLASFLVFGHALALRSENANLSSEQQALDDAFTSLDNSGALLEETDDIANFSLDMKAQAVLDRARSLLPQGYDLNVELKQYSYDPQACRSNPTFNSCFLLTGTGTAGNGWPGDRTLVAGQKLIVKKERPGDCNIGPDVNLEFSAPFFSPATSPIMLSPADPLGQFRSYLSGLDKILNFAAGDGNLFVDVNVTDLNTGAKILTGQTISCDQYLRVDLNTGFNTTGRSPLNMIFGADKSSSTKECAIAKGTTVKSSNGTLPVSSAFSLLDTFSLTDNNAFSILLEWAGSCSSNCPEFKIQSPSDVNYGAGMTTTTQINTFNCTDGDSPQSKVYYQSKTLFDYLAAGSSAANNKSGAWKVWVRNSGIARDYNLTVKLIRNQRVNATPNIVEWNEPISKIELAQLWIWKFNQLPPWNPIADEYAYAEIGVDSVSGTQIQPSSGLRPIGDQAFLSQLKNLSAIGTEDSAFGYALDGRNGMINDTLAAQPSSELRIVVLFGDGNNTGSPTVFSAGADANSKNIIIYSVGIGRDFNFSSLKQLAYMTGGLFFNAYDENSLDLIFQLISNDIIGRGMNQSGIGAPDLNLHIPVAPGSVVFNGRTSFQGTCVIDSASDGGVPGQCAEKAGNKALDFNIHNVDILSTWTGGYDLVYPCNNDFACSTNTRLVPEQGSNYTWRDVNGVFHPPYFDANRQLTLTFLYRDFKINFVSAELVDLNFIDANLRLRNDGNLNAWRNSVSDTNTRFFLESIFPSAELLPPLAQFAPLFFDGNLCGNISVGCKREDWNKISFLREGLLYARIDENKLRDCPRGNIAAMECRSGPFTRFYALQYKMWRK